MLLLLRHRQRLVRLLLLLLLHWRRSRQTRAGRHHPHHRRRRHCCRVRLRSPTHGHGPSSSSNSPPTRACRHGGRRATSSRRRGGAGLLGLALLPAFCLLAALDRLAVFHEVELEGLYVLVEAEGAHGPKEVIAVDGLAFLLLAFVAGFRGDEGDEFRDAFLHGFLGVLGDLGVGGLWVDVE